MTQTDRPTDTMKAKGLARVGFVFLVLSGLMLAIGFMEAADTPGIFAADEVSAHDFTNGTDQAILTGTLQVRDTWLDLEEVTVTSMQLTGGASMTALSPFTQEDWQPGDPVNVIIISPTISGVTPDTTQIAARGYMNELQSRPDNMMVTLLPEETRTALGREHADVDGVSEDTLFVWADHVNATKFGSTRAPFGFVPGIGTFLFACGFFIAARVFKGRAQRV